MNFNNAYFEASYGTLSQLPVSDMPEVCFSGRSNVGKSFKQEVISESKQYTGENRYGKLLPT